jgi:Sulfotransferase family
MVVLAGYLLNRMTTNLIVESPARSLFSQVCNGALAAFERLPRPRRRPDVTSLLAIAERQTGLSDFGDSRFLEAMAFLLESIEREAKLNALGRFVFYQHTIQLLRNRLYLERDSRIDRRISSRKITKPVFITGLPRTGTTLLHSLLDQDQELFAAPLTWEVIYPSPAQGETRRRIARTERDLKWFDRLVPAFRPIHPLSAELPQECVAIMSHCFMSQEFDTMFDLPEYELWLEEQDQRPVYEFHKQFLQHLRPEFPERRFVLKAPAHLHSLEAIFAVYPDAQIVHTYRDPLQVIPSLANLTFVLKSAFSRDLDPMETGPSVLQYCLRNLRRFFASRQRLPANCCTDVAYGDLVLDPISVVRRIYAKLGEQLTADAESRMIKFMSETPQTKWGRHVYSAATFGLEPSAIAEQFRFYIERFNMASPWSETAAVE